LPLSGEVMEMDYDFRAMELMAHLASVMRMKMLHPFDTIVMANIEANLLEGEFLIELRSTRAWMKI
jgi:hypothetical protein